MPWRFPARPSNQFSSTLLSSVTISPCKYRKPNKGHHVTNLDFLRFLYLSYLCKETIFIILISILLVLKIALDFNKHLWNKLQNKRGCQLNTLRKESSTLVCPLKLYLARACPSDCRAASWACSMEVIT